MASITHIRKLQNLGQYLPDGVAAAMEPIVRFMTPAQQLADSATLYAATLVHTIVAVDATTGAYPCAILAKSNGSACVVKVYAADDATVGTTNPLAAVGVSATAGKFSWCVFGGDGIYDLAVTNGSGVGAAAPSDDDATATTNDPDVWILYFDG